MTIGVSEDEAFELVMSRFKTAWNDPDTGAPSILSYSPQVLWPDVRATAVQRGKIIAKLIWTIPAKTRKTIGTPALWDYTGSFFVMILTPVESVEVEFARQLGNIVKLAFQGKSESQYFNYREVILRPMPAVDNWHQYRAEVKFQGTERI